jgi:uroporphyrin-III C-methyltransferase / precorrin-2 dehydrogenase / sirohydrochlorin ferrochelatase
MNSIGCDPAHGDRAASDPMSRSPTEAPTPRMAALARLPIFLALRNKRAVVSGGSAAAAWKAELLWASGARVEVYAEDPSAPLSALAAEAPGVVTVHRRRLKPADLDGAALAVGAIEGEEEAAAFANAARAAGVPVNVVDKPALCDFAFGAIVNRSPLVIGISTDGAAPVFGQAIRAKLEALIPRGFSRWAEAARNWRPRIQSLGLSLAARRRLWERFAQTALARPNDVPDAAELEALASGIDAEPERAGSVVLVGAGPGDPELLTLRAVRALQSADVILIDDLVAPDILDFARREARKMLVGKTGYGPSCRQDEINQLMISLARAGRRVVRLKSGDPMVFGRAGEEIAACRAAGIAVEVVPGITAAQGVASRLGVALTHRRLSRRLQYVSGHHAEGGLSPQIDWKSLADPATTTVIYMPKRTLRAVAAAALEHGIDPATPAVAVADATRDGEIVLRGTVADIAARLEAASPPGPVLVMIGGVLGAAAAAGAQRKAAATERAATP